VTNSSVAKKTGLPDIRAVIGDRRLALFGHVIRLPEGAPVHDALQMSVELLAGTTSVPYWRRKQGNPRSSWLCGVLKDAQLTAQEARIAAADREGNSPLPTKRSDDDVFNIPNHNS